MQERLPPVRLGSALVKVMLRVRVRVRVGVRVRGRGRVIAGRVLLEAKAHVLVAHLGRCRGDKGGDMGEI